MSTATGRKKLTIRDIAAMKKRGEPIGSYQQSTADDEFNRFMDMVG